jgi:hypothetical protein
LFVHDARRRLKAGRGQNCPPYRQVWHFGHTADSVRNYLDDVLVTVGIREFLGNLAAYLLQSQAPVAITRHGDTIGYYIPLRRKRTAAERAAFKEAAARFDEMLTAKGLTEDELMADFKKWRVARRK